MLGPDVMIGSGRIRVYPSFLAVGARAFRHATNAVMQGVKISDYAVEHEELKTALTKWGTGRTGFQM